MLAAYFNHLFSHGYLQHLLLCESMHYMLHRHLCARCTHRGHAH